MLGSSSSVPRASQALLFGLFLLSHWLVASNAATLLRTGEVSAAPGDGHSSSWLSHPGRRRQLLGEATCSDARWGPLCGRVQLLLQLAEGYTPQDAQQLAARLHADRAVISTALPTDTWLVLAHEQSALDGGAYRPHVLLPYAPEYKVAPEWGALLEVVHAHQQQHQHQHVAVHKRILQHEAVQQLQLVRPADELRLAAAKAAASGGLAAELRQAPPDKVLIGVHFPDVPASALQRLSTAGASFHPSAAAAQDWRQPLLDVVARADRSPEHLHLCQPELLSRSPWELDVAVCPQDLSEVLYWLSNQAAVHWLAPRPRLFYQNAVASAIVQSNTMKTALDYTTPQAHAFWDAGLDGRNQIVGMGDSGIDMDSCFFSDPANPFAVPAAGALEWASPSHRKVVFYWALADESFRDLVGHGTHTAGSVAGFNPAAPDSRGTGAAKGARLAFADLSRTAGGDVNAPQDLEANYFPKLAARGACIFTDSWGSTSPIYDFQASKLDSWLYNNQDCISHFAAGNYGENDNLDSTITSPATSKNAVTVGATKTATVNYVSQTIAPVFTLSVEIRRPSKPSQFLGVRLVKADFGGDGASLSNKGLRVVRAVPDVACGSLDGAATGAYTNAIVLVRRGSCYFSQKMAAGAAAGAAAVVVINDKAGGYFKMDAQDNPGAGGTLPLFAVTRRIGEQLWASFENAESVAATIERYAQGWPAYEDIASFSSFGPTNDGRIKPDIVGPGELVSAASGDMDPATAAAPTCGMGRKAGTSMATPLVAGHAALIRQYFMDGFYPTGAPGNAAHTPSGPLIKAVMLGGACDMQGNTEQFLPLEDSPSMRQGFGRLCLCSSLKLGNNCTTNVQLVDRVPITSQASHKYCLRTSGGGDVRVTLVWYDYPAPVSAEKTLVNDLDLTVVSGGMGGQAFFGNMDLKRDTVNTVERVWLRNPPPGGLDITVTAQTLSPLTPAQNYTLVVQGAFLDTLAGPHNPDKAAAGRALGGCTPEQMATVAAVQPAAAAATAATAAAAVVPAATAAAPAPQVVEEKGPAANASANVTAAAPAQPAAAAATVPVAVQSAAAAVTPAQPAVQPAAVQPVAAATVAAPTVVQPTPADAAAAAATATTAAAAAAPVQPSPADAAAAASAAATTATAAAAVPATVAAGDKASLVNALFGAMSAQPQQAAAVPAATVAVAATAALQQGRRLTWVPNPSMAAWLVDPNVSVSVKMPALVCRLLNASNAGSSSAGSTARASNTVLIPVPAVLLGSVLLLVLCCALFVAGARHYSIARSISLTSAVHHESSANKRMGRAATGESALREALLSDPSILEQLSPNKRAALGLQQRPLAPSPSGSADSFSSHATSSSGCSDAPPSAAAEAAAGLMPLAPLRVRLAREPASNSSPAALSPLMPGSPLSLAGAMSAPASMPALSPAGSLGAPLQLRSASVTNSPLGRRSSGSPLPGVAEAQAAVKRMSAPAGLEVLVDDSTGGGAGAAVLAQLALGSSRSRASTPSPGSLRRGSYSFTFGAPLPHMLEPEVAAAAADAAAPPRKGHWGLFAATAEQAGCSSDVAHHLPGQLRSKSVKEQPVWQQQEQWQQEQQHGSAARAASPADAAVVHRDQQQ